MVVRVGVVNWWSNSYTYPRFSCFLQQLNFYAFRKIKYSDTIRIDPKLEAETANYWRFRHEHFQRGKPHLLTEIKRMNGSSAKAASSTKTTTTFTPKAADAAVSVEEVRSLKKKIAEMSKSIDDLTAMVEKVSLKQDEREDTLVHKRTKVEPVTMSMAEDVRPDEMLSTMELEEMAVALPVASMPDPMPMVREESLDSQLSDNAFVDQLFDAFKEEDDDVLVLDGPSVDENRPDPELMRRLGDALMLLPREIQEMIVDRLIAAITTTDLVDDRVVAALSDETKKVIVSGKALPVLQTPLAEEKREPAGLPLAAATLAALLHHYNSQVQGKSPKHAQKSIPVIPVHA